MTLFAAWHFTSDWLQQCVDETNEHHLNLMKKQKSAGMSYCIFFYFSFIDFIKSPTCKEIGKDGFVNHLWHFFIVKKKKIHSNFSINSFALSLSICLTSSNLIIHSSHSIFHYTEERSNFITLLESPFFCKKKKKNFFPCNKMLNKFLSWNE